MEAKFVKKALYGIIASDGCVYGKGRFSLYSSREDFCNHVYGICKNLTHWKGITLVRYDKRFDTYGYSISGRQSRYFQKFQDIFYPNGRKQLTKYSVDRFDEVSYAYIWMCDGYLEHAKNRKINKVQNIGWFCLEAFPKEELELVQKSLLEKWGIESSLVKKPWGFGYRIRIGGKNLQRFISIIYPYITDCFKCKTILFYRKKEYFDMTLPNAEHIIQIYNDVEDIVRHPLKNGKTNQGTATST